MGDSGKLYDPAYAIKKADVDSFLSESVRYDFAYRLLIATTDRLGSTARSGHLTDRDPECSDRRGPGLWPDCRMLAKEKTVTAGGSPLDAALSALPRL